MKTKIEEAQKAHIHDLEQQLAVSELKVQACEQTNEALDAELARARQDLKEVDDLRTQNAKLNTLVQARNAMVAELQIKVDELQSELDDTPLESTGSIIKTRTIEDLERKVSSLTTNNLILRQECDRLMDKDRDSRLSKRNEYLEKDISLKSSTIKGLEQTNSALQADRKNLEAEVRRLQDQLSRKSPWPEGCHGSATDEPGDTTSVIWPRQGLTPEVLAALGELEEQLEHERRSARECNCDTNKYWQKKYVEAKRLYELQMRTASEQVASLQKKLENARGSADGWVADIESSLKHWKEYAGKLESQLKVTNNVTATEVPEILEQLRELRLENDDLRAKFQKGCTDLRHTTQCFDLALKREKELEARLNSPDYPYGKAAHQRLVDDVRMYKSAAEISEKDIHDLRAKLEGARARSQQEAEENIGLATELMNIHHRVAVLEHTVSGR